MSSLKLYGSTSGYVEVAPEATAQNNSVTIPNTTGTIAVKDASGNLGIGTDNPGAKLDVRGSNNPLLKLTQTTSGIARLNIESETNDGYQYAGIGIGTASADAELMWTTEGFDVNVADSVRLRIPSSGDVQVLTGNLVIGTSGKGIDFSANGNAAGMTSELLDDYEEGTFTPSFTGGTSGSGYTRQVGEYTKVGKLVTFTLTIDGDGGLTGTATAIEIGGLPFTSRNITEIGGAQYSYPGNFDTTNDRRFWLVAQNNTTLSYRSVTSANINGNLVTNINSQFILYGHYFTDS